MENQMRFKQYAMEEAVVADFLRQGLVGRLGTVCNDGFPYIVPVHYVYYADKIYFHCAKIGHKMKNINNDSRVCFEVDEMLHVEDNPDPCEATTIYKSVVIFGQAQIIDEAAERTNILEQIVHKYLPARDGVVFDEKTLSATNVIAITIEQITGKSNE